MATIAAQKTEIVGIQYLRGLAAILVLLVHSDHMLQQGKYLGYSYIGDFANGGNLGVDLFFVISGFIMFHITNGFSLTIDGKQFLWRRFVRIVPFMWVCIAFVFILRSGVRGGIDPIPFLRGSFLWPVGDLDPNPIWTLRHELFFYLSTFLAVTYRKGHLLLAAFLLLPIPLSLLGTLFPESDLLHSELVSNIFNVRANCGFAMGVGVGWLFSKRAIWHGAKMGTFAAIGSVPLLLAFEYFLYPFSMPTELHTSGPDGQVDWDAMSIQLGKIPAAFKCLLTSLLCGCLVYGSFGCSAGASWLEKLGLLIGNASYSIYLTHEVMISFTGIAFAAMKFQHVGVAAGWLSVIASIVFGILVHLSIEKPLISSARKWLEPQRPAVVGT